MSESSLYFKQRLKSTDVDLDADLIGVAHPKGGTTDDLAMSLRELSKAIGGSAAAPLIIKGPTGIYIKTVDQDGADVAQIRFGGAPLANGTNIGIGYNANLYNMQGGFGNIGIGGDALANHTSANAYWTVALGQNALKYSTEPNLCTAIGAGAMANLAGFISRNVAVGTSALAGADPPALSTSPHWSTAIGFNAVRYGGAGGNTGCGSNTLFNTVAGQNNVALGSNAGYNNVDGFYHVCLGYNAGPATGALTNTISIGNAVAPTVSNTAIIGDATVTDAYFGSVTGASKLHGKGDAIVFPSADPHIVGAGYWAGAVWTRSAG